MAKFVVAVKTTISRSKHPLKLSIVTHGDCKAWGAFSEPGCQSLGPRANRTAG